MTALHIPSRDLSVKDTHISGNGWWASKNILAFLPEYRGKWCVTFALESANHCPGVNFPCVIDDYGNLVRVT